MYYSNIFVKCYIFYIFSFDIFHMSKQNRVGFSECYYSNIFLKCYIFYIFSFDIFHISKQNRVGLVNATILCRSVRFHSLPTFLSKIAKTKLLQLFFTFKTLKHFVQLLFNLFWFSQPPQLAQ